MPIRRFLAPGSTFGPDELKIMSSAFEAALHRMGPDGEADDTKERLARRIIAVAKQGERDAKKLCEKALRACELYATSA